MPERDVYHDIVKTALIKDGWTITHDPLTISFGDKDLYVDLGAEQPIGAEKDGQKIAVEVKSFLGKSDVTELERTIGQYFLYLDILSEIEPDRVLYVAVPEEAFLGIFSGRLGHLVLSRHGMKLIVFDVSLEVILRWIH